MLNILVIDGHDPADSAEPQLVSMLCAKSPKIASYYCTSKEALEQQLTDHCWDIIWFSGHTTVRPKAASFDKREGSVFRKLCDAEVLANAHTELLVLSSCNTNVFVPPLSQYSWQAACVIGHGGELPISHGLVFAARFMSTLIRQARRDRLETGAVMDAYHEAVAVATAQGGHQWYRTWLR